MIILPPRVKTNEEEKSGIILPSRVKIPEKKETIKTTNTIENTDKVPPAKKEIFLPPKKDFSETEKYNKEQSTFLKSLARIVLPKKLESAFGVEKIENVKSNLVDGWKNLTPEQQIKAKQVVSKETPEALKPKLPSFFQSLKETSTKDIPFYGSGKEALEYVNVAQAYDRVKDEKGTDRDKELLNDFYDEMDRKSELSKNVGYKVGETIKGSARFMGELLPVALIETFTGTLAPAGEAYATSKIAQKGTIEVIKKMLTDKVTRNLVKNVAEKKFKTLATQFIITAPTNITKGTAERMIGVIDTETGEVYQEGQPISEAIINATTGHAVELATEMGGGVSGKVLSGLTSPLKRVATKTAIFKALQKKFIKASDSQIEALLKKTGWNGVIGEFMEERDADIFNDALYRLGLGDQKFEGLTKDDIATEFLAFSVMGTGVKVGTKIAEGLAKRKDIEKIKKEAESRKATIETPEGKEEIVLPPKKAPVKPEIAPTSEIKTKMTKDTTPSFLPPKKAEFIKKDETIDPLIQEAKKYKSVEEFVKALGEPVYHSTDANIKLFDDKFNTERPTQFTTDKTLFRGKGKNQYEAFVNIKNPYKKSVGEVVNILDLKSKGYDGITNSTGKIVIPFDSSSIKTKSQLTDIWNKAQEKVPETAPALPQKEKKTEPIKKIDSFEASIEEMFSQPQIEVMPEELSEIDKWQQEEIRKVQRELQDISDLGNLEGQYNDFVNLLKNPKLRNKKVREELETGDSRRFREIIKEKGLLDTQSLDNLLWSQDLNDSEIYDLFIAKAFNELYPSLEKQQLKNRQEKIKKIREIGVSRSNLPVGEGKMKASKLESRIKNLLGNLSQDKIDEIGVSTYKELNKKENIAKASEYVSQHPKKALQVLTGEIEAPDGVLRNSIYIAMMELGKSNAEIALKVASLASTRAGQEISILTEIDGNSPVKVMSDIINIKEKKAEQMRKGKTKKQVESGMKDKVNEDTQKRTKQARKSKKSWLSLIDELKC